MERYLAFLRDINISGKNKISMAELKSGFESLDFAEVKTYLNSGNVIFSSDNDDIDLMKAQIEPMIKNLFQLDIPVFVISKEDLESILHNAPNWWDNENKDIYDNLIFVMPPAPFVDVFNEIGEPKEGLEQISNYKMQSFGRSAEKIIRKQTGGQRQQVQILAVS